MTWYNQEGREGGFKYHHVPIVFLNFEDNEKLGLHHLAWEIVLIYFYIMTIYSYIDVVNNIHIKKTWTIEKRKREKEKKRNKENKKNIRKTKKYKKKKKKIKM